MAGGFERGIVMWKDHKKTIIVTSILILLPVLMGIYFWDQLPEVIATHFGYDGEPNGWSSKWFAVAGLPLFSAVVHLFCIFITGKDPRYDKYPEKMKHIVLWICPVVSWIGAVSIYSYELHWNFNMMNWIGLILGGSFIIIGNYLPKVKQNYYLGIKLPWTYASEDNWNKTHRLGGKVWFAGGILLLFNGMVKIKYLEIVIFLAMVMIPTVYSYWYSRKEAKERLDD